MANRTPGRTRYQDLWTMSVKNNDGSTSRVPSARHGRGRRWKAEIINDEGKPVSELFARKDDARRWLEEQTARRATGSFVDPKVGKATLRTFYEAWSKYQVWVSSTERAMSLAVNSATFRDVPFNNLKPSHVQTWIKYIQDKPLQPSTIHTRFVNVRGVIRAAVRDRLITSDVTVNAKLPRQRKASASMAIPTPAEVGRLLQQADSHFVAFIGLCAFGGMRLGEAAALQVGDVDFLRREIRVTRQVQRANGKQVEIRAPKYGSERTIYSPDELIEAVSEHIRLHRPGDDGSRWLFPGEGEHRLHQNSVGYLWRKAKTAAGIDYRLHDLRHFYASGLIAAGCDVVTVQRALGHGSASVTLDKYVHLWPDANDRTRQAARELFAQCDAYPVRTGGQKKGSDLQS